MAEMIAMSPCPQWGENTVPLQPYLIMADDNFVMLVIYIYILAMVPEIW